LTREFQPYLNFAAGSDGQPSQSAIDEEESDGKFALMCEEEEAFWRQSYNRLKQKIEQINRMVDNINYANHSDDTLRTLVSHRILEENLQDFLGVGEIPE
jgi:hypothetical protein